MASPQLEKGYGRYAHELMEALVKRRFGSGAIKVVLFVLRQTYGAKGAPKTAEISAADVSYAIGFSRRRAAQLIAAMVRANVFVEATPPGFRTGRVLGVQKDYDLWKIPHPGAPEDSGKTVIHSEGSLHSEGTRYFTVYRILHCEVPESRHRRGLQAAGD